MDLGLAILLSVLAAGLLARNWPVALAAGIVLAIRLARLPQVLTLIDRWGVDIGIVMLTTAVLAPLALGRIDALALRNVFSSGPALLAIAIGIVLSMIAARGIPLLMAQPVLVTALTIGTVLGVTLFRGIPVGPLIAAGMLALLLGLKPGS